MMATTFLNSDRFFTVVVAFFSSRRDILNAFLLGSEGCSLSSSLAAFRSSINGSIIELALANQPDLAGSSYRHVDSAALTIALEKAFAVCRPSIVSCLMFIKATFSNSAAVLGSSCLSQDILVFFASVPLGLLSFS